MVTNAGYAAASATSPLAPWTYTIREPLENEVLMKVAYCGICHFDVTMSRNEFNMTTFPCVPGHEIVGVACKLGSKVTKFKIGDHVGVGCLVNSCKTCVYCKDNKEQYCAKRVMTYSDRSENELTYGGYGRYVVCREDFVLRIPAGIPLPNAAPLLCAGITTYSPMIRNNMNRGGLKVGVVGLGGLGHMAVQFSAAFGNETWVLSRSEAKKKEALELGAKGLIVSSDLEAMKAHAGFFDYLMDTSAADKATDDYLALLRQEGTLINVGAPPHGAQLKITPVVLLMGGKTVEGSACGSIQRTQEMLDFCAEKKISSVIEKIDCSKVNEAFKRVEKGDVKFRFVLDIENTGPEVSAVPAPRRGFCGCMWK